MAGRPKASWSLCAECGDANGRIGPEARTPRRYDGSRFGIDGQLCDRCYQRHNWRAKHAGRQAVPCARCGQATYKSQLCQSCSSRIGDLRRNQRRYGTSEAESHNVFMTTEEFQYEWAHLEVSYFGELAEQLRVSRAFGGEMLTALSDHGPEWKPG